ncbi:MAG: formate dehydrogenase accessory sulfurtransferase FdhD [Opitutae bacterium]|mgnify:FL=1|nr:formate dehydrogenase accessory sulfurtransferase FdhD [Opitutae bacterium]MBT7852262.1 formate dehydrogenase accessory sulfurtransferase FdhD [Opitutae bacterium]
MEQSVRTKIKKIRLADESIVEDFVALEEPLEIQLSYLLKGQRVVRSITITMRTPGQDKDLALGFLLTEGIICNLGQVQDVIVPVDEKSGKPEENRLRVILGDAVSVDVGKMDRNFYTTSSCGICGKASLEALNMAGSNAFTGNRPKLLKEIIFILPKELLQHQSTFLKTGGLHAAGLFNANGELQTLREDVGRHNAVDKVAGSILQDNTLCPQESILLVSGRTSFEIVQKAVRAEIPFVLGVGPPSSLAVELSNTFNVTLLGFVSSERFNIYSSPERVLD